MSKLSSSQPFLAFSILQVLLIIGLLFIQITDKFIGIYNPLFIATSICTLVLFAFGFPIFKRLAIALKGHSKSTHTIVLIQFFLHLIIVAFIFFDHLYSINYIAMLWLSPFLIAFFLTARITWQACFAVLKSKIYKIFTTGSTALLVWCIVLTLLGLSYQERFLSNNLHTLLLVYFAIHFAELGFVLLKINKDLKAI